MSYPVETDEKGNAIPPIPQKAKKRKRCYKNRYDVRKVFGSICDDCPKQAECY